MNKKQKIFGILGLTLILFLTGMPFLVRSQTFLPPGILPAQNVGVLGLLKAGYQWATGNTEGAAQTLKGGDVMIGQYIVGTLGVYLVKVAGFLTNFTLNLNLQLLDDSFITTGWTICRDLANLGFVLFIIIIAIATILRYQEYGAKSTLAKLIAVALLVNFSLLGAGVFVDFSNMLTKSFITKAVGDSSWSTGATWNFATAIANSVSPGKFLSTENSEKATGFLPGLINAFTDPVGSLKSALIWIASFFFVIIFTLLLAFVLFAVAIMFLVRYIALSILLVLVPLACLFWVIPATKSLWEKWWNNFMRWILFAPTATFFLFLAVQMIQGQSDKFKEISQTAQGVGNLNNLDLQGTLLNQDFPAQITHMVLLVAFVLGGLIAANSLSITGAKTFYGWAQAGGKWMGRKTLEKTAGRVLGAKPIKTLTEKLSASKIPGVSYLGLGLNRLGARVEGITQEPYKKLAKELSRDRFNYEVLSSRGAKRATLLETAPKKIDVEKLAPILNNPAQFETIRGEFKTAGFDPNNFDKATGRSLEMVKAAAVGDIKKLQKATDEFSQKLGAEDWKKIPFNGIFRDVEEDIKKGLPGAEVAKIIQNQWATNFVQNSGILRKITPKITTNIANYQVIIDNQIKKLSPEDAKKIKDTFKRILGRKMFGTDIEVPAPET
jgi:hypothetical protein